MHSRILKFCILAFLFLTLIFSPLSIKAEDKTENKIPVYLFFGNGCSHCAKVLPFVEKLSTDYPELIIYGFEIYQNKDNALKLLEFYKKYDIPAQHQGVPIIFLPDKYLMGAQQIPEKLEIEFKRIVATYKIIGPKPMPQEKKSALQEKKSEKKPEALPLKSLSIIAITTAALADSINPCAIAVLIILLSALMIVNNKKRALLGGLAFISSIYIAYFLFGLGILKAIQVVNIDARIIYKIVGVLAILIGLANLKDVVWYGKAFVMEIPQNWRPTLQALLKKVSSPLGAFLIGFVVVLFELPCTGGPYLFVLGLLYHHKTYSTIVPWLVYYNIFFVLPLIILAFLIYFGHSSLGRAEQWKNKNIRLLHLITGLIMLGLGIWVLFY